MKDASYVYLWQALHSRAYKAGIPLRVMFELTYRCNFRCPHCYVPRSYKKKYACRELTTKKVFSILRQLRDAGCFYLGFTGGEPFLRKDALRIFGYARKLGFEFIIYTNGSLFDKDIARRLSFLKPNKVDITIPALHRKSFSRITGRASSYEKFFSGIKLLKKEKINLGFKTCLLKQNQAEISRIQDFAASLNSFHRLDELLLPRLDGSQAPYRHRALRKKPIMPLPSVKHGCSDEPFLPQQEAIFKCGSGISQAAITPAGELKMCLMIDYPKYKIIAMTFKEAWQRLRKLALSIKPDKNYRCAACKLQDSCKWCPAMAWLENKTFTSCVPRI